VPNFTFTNWRELKKNYPLEIFTADQPAFFNQDENWETRATAVLFSYQEKSGAKFQKVELAPLDVKAKNINDGFYNEYNQKRLLATITKAKRGEGMVTKTIDELEAMENK
jgi:hypothetical protein